MKSLVAPLKNRVRLFLEPLENRESTSGLLPMTVTAESFAASIPAAARGVGMPNSVTVAAKMVGPNTETFGVDYSDSGMTAWRVPAEPAMTPEIASMVGPNTVVLGLAPAAVDAAFSLPSVLDVQVVGTLLALGGE
jgi:hypothetical protein